MMSTEIMPSSSFSMPFMTASVLIDGTNETSNIAEKQMIFNLGLASLNFTTDLDNETSARFISLSNLVCNEVVGNLSTLPNGTNCTVLDFRAGSVFAIIQLTFPDLIENSQKSYSAINSIHGSLVTNDDIFASISRQDNTPV
ncbi:hypothetical protein RRG08_057714 [Elysia crispata]|uniref:Uncharacterized protein n=1 Tax=Elysia crispata TaxID=231223 RepID=A0AAE1DEA2_9GAST|nr:hypothetical protein RRG08_057714 [Elysia crispata]